MASLLDTQQEEAQQIFPHLYERFKTDGVEYNMYIGDSISQYKVFSKDILSQLRLWQLRTMCKLEIEFFNSKHLYPLTLEVASMILIYDKTLTIRFRKDEKQFDVDGSYNVRYEIIKKRIDKALVKGTDERITIPGKIVIVYDQASVKDEYLPFIKTLQQEGLLDEKIEHFELEKLKGITGLYALRVKMLYTS